MDPTRPQPICTLYPFIFDNYILCFPAEFAYADGPFLQLPLQLCVTWIKVNAVLHHGRQRPNANDAKTVHVYNSFRKWKFCDRGRRSRQVEEVAPAPEGARGRPPRWARRRACRGVAATRALARRALSIRDPRRQRSDGRADGVREDREDRRQRRKVRT